MKRYSFLWLLVAVVAMTSCQDEFIKNENKTSDMIGYAVETNSISEPLKSRASRSSGTTDVAIEELDQTLGGKQLYLHTITDMVMPMDIKAEKKKDTKNPQSRGAITYTGDVKNIGVTSIVWNGTSWGDSGTERKLYMDNVVAEKNSSFQTNYYWPAAEQHIRFFAYHPADAVSIANSDDKSTQTIEWTVPKVVANQHDLLVASSDYAGDYKATADLFFGHALTAVQFKLSNEITGVTVTAVRIKGVKYKGTYTYDYCGRNGDDGDSDTGDTDAGTWEVEDGTNDFEVSGLTDKAEDLFAEDRGEDKGIINYGENTFMMMPQTLPDGATIEVDVIDNGAATPETQTLTATIGKKVWQKGTKVIYTVSFNTYNEEYILQISDGTGAFGSELNVAEPFQYYGGFGNYRIRSYKKITRLGNKDPDYDKVAWQADMANMVGVDFLTGEKGDGIEDPDDADATKTYEGVFQFGAIGVVSSPSHTELTAEENKWIWRESEVYKTTPFDLSKIIIDGYTECSRHTANCYIVRAPGYYRIPVVYGNAIKDGVVNENAFKTTAVSPGTVEAPRSKLKDGSTTESELTGDNGIIKVEVLNNFVDHANGFGNSKEGNPIVGPWIEDQEASPYNDGTDYTPASAEIVWQDAPCLLTDVKVKQMPDEGQDRYFLLFHVHPDAICDGNAVVAVKNAAGHIMWSWHIWVSFKNNFTPMNVTNRRVLGNYATGSTINEVSAWTREESQFGLMQAYVGYCNGETRTYAKRDNCKVEFYQVDDSGNPIVGAADKVSINFSVNGGSVKTENSSPTYQFGRKDPMLPFFKMEDGSTYRYKLYYDNERKLNDPNLADFDKTKILSEYKNRKYISLSIQNPLVFLRQNDNGPQANEIGTPPSNGTVTDDVVWDSGDKYVIYRNWCKNLYLNLWNANCNKLPMFSYVLGVEPDEYHNKFNDLVKIPVVKTVYDPCPPGWEMPRVDAFTGTTIDGTTSKPYWVYDGENLPKVPCASSNMSTQKIVKDDGYYSYEYAFFVDPMPALDSRVTGGRAYFVQGFGHRNNQGNPAAYAEYINVLTSSMACIQWMNEQAGKNNGVIVYPHNFELHSMRLCVIHGAENDAYNGGWGSTRPNSGSTLDLAFGVIPAKTGSNPIRTEVKVGGDINPWGSGGNIGIEF